MEKQYTQIGGLPETFLDLVMREFVPYSVALGRVEGENASSFIPLGSGTIVRRAGNTGILTAHHCLHSSEPKVSIGHGGTDTLALLCTRGRTVILQPEEAVEVPLALPDGGSYNEWGPDLTFLQIEPGARLESLLAYGSVWNLDHQIDEVAPGLCEAGNLLASVGFPEEFCRTRIDGNDIHRLGHHETAINVIAEDSIEERDGWDYLTITCDYAGSPKLPASFKGFSGGGIWSMQLRRHKDDDQISIEKSGLVGVTFWETDRIGDERKLRGHFVKSIYDRAWIQE